MFVLAVLVFDLVALLLALAMLVPLLIALGDLPLPATMAVV